MILTCLVPDVLFVDGHSGQNLMDDACLADKLSEMLGSILFQHRSHIVEMSVGLFINKQVGPRSIYKPV